MCDMEPGWTWCSREGNLLRCCQEPAGPSPFRVHIQNLNCQTLANFAVYLSQRVVALHEELLAKDCREHCQDSLKFSNSLCGKNTVISLSSFAKRKISCVVLSGWNLGVDMNELIARVNKFQWIKFCCSQKARQKTVPQKVAKLGILPLRKFQTKRYATSPYSCLRDLILTTFFWTLF